MLNWHVTLHHQLLTPPMRYRTKMQPPCRAQVLGHECSSPTTSGNSALQLRGSWSEAAVHFSADGQYLTCKMEHVSLMAGRHAAKCLGNAFGMSVWSMIVSLDVKMNCLHARPIY